MRSGIPRLSVCVLVCPVSVMLTKLETRLLVTGERRAPSLVFVMLTYLTLLYLTRPINRLDAFKETKETCASPCSLKQLETSLLVYGYAYLLTIPYFRYLRDFNQPSGCHDQN
jgi:hypothetical protein